MLQVLLITSWRTMLGVQYCSLSIQLCGLYISRTEIWESQYRRVNNTHWCTVHDIVNAHWSNYWRAAFVWRTLFRTVNMNDFFLTHYRYKLFNHLKLKPTSASKFIVFIRMKRWQEIKSHGTVKHDCFFIILKNGSDPKSKCRWWEF